MPIHLSTPDLASLAQTIGVLAAPLDHPTVDEWRHAVNESMKRLLGADSAGFLLPVESGMALLSRDHDPESLARYPDIPIPPLSNGMELWSRLIELGAGGLSQVYGAGLRECYLSSAYYNEFAAPNGATDTMMMTTPVALRAGGIGLASVQLWHASERGAQFGEREQTLVRLLFPVFQSAVRMQQRWERQRPDLVQMFDSLGDAASLHDAASGAELHRTPRLVQLLAGDHGAALLMEAMRQTVATLRGLAAEIGGAIIQASPMERVIQTASNAYSIRSCIYGGGGVGSALMIVVLLERRFPLPLSGDQLRDIYSLTSAEVRVARLLGEGKSNAELAAVLTISPNTARRHTEQVLRKMKARSRAEVAGRLQSS